LSRRRKKLSDEEKTITIHNKLRPKSENQRKYIEDIKENIITIAYGPAGSGKTAIATAIACEMFAKGEIDKIIICRPLVESGRKLGDLPGDLREKLEPYLIPIFDEMLNFFEQKQIEQFFYEKRLELCPLELMRGRNFHDTFIILDESQNSTFEQLKMAITRVGLSSKMVICGDLKQTDLPFDKRGALETFIKRLENVKGVAISRLDTCDIQRNPIIASILEALDG
jgi:phosphate starvation-inducible PhoH-like protein